MSSPGEMQSPRAPFPYEYPSTYQCVDGDLLVSEQSVTSTVTTVTGGINSSECTDAYSIWSRCTNCVEALSVNNCGGGAPPIQPFPKDCKNSSQVGCPFCESYTTSETNNRLINRYIREKGIHIYPPYRTDPYDTDNTDHGYGCGCDGREIQCGDGPNNGRRGVCSSQTFLTYDLGFIRTCSGIDATVTVLFSTRTDFNAQDFPVMGGFVAAFQPTGLAMDGTSYQVAVYPYTSFSEVV